MKAIKKSSGYKRFSENLSLSPILKIPFKMKNNVFSVLKFLSKAKTEKNHPETTEPRTPAPIRKLKIVGLIPEIFNFSMISVTLANRPLSIRREFLR